MKIVSAIEAKTHFEQFLDSVQREPVVVTKKDRLVAIML
ncbi:type II toxin-antitoxin system Phd/YefM family antitoxin, partial [Bathymodiolus thermophilus thioautotrophic gill symbiont]